MLGRSHILSRQGARRGLLLALALGGASACQADPSYRMRWTIAERDSQGLDACADSGLFEVQAIAFALPTGQEINFASFLRDERSFACHPSAFDRGGSVGGAALPPGEYVIQVRALDRGGDIWIEEGTGPIRVVNDDEGRLCDIDLDCSPAAPTCLFGLCFDGSEGDPCDGSDDCADPLACNADGQCEYVTGCDPATEYSSCVPGQLVCDCQRLTVLPEGGSALDGAVSVVEGATVELPPFSLVAPGECIDGIDNDHDGRIDGNDPSCAVDFGDGTEGLPVGVTEVQLSISFLGQLPLSSCASVPVGGVQLWVGDQRELGFSEPSQLLFEDSCQLERPYFTTVRLSAGTATFSVVGLDQPCDEAACADDDRCLGSTPECYPAACVDVHAECDANGLGRQQCATQFPDVPECFVPADQAVTTIKTFTADILENGGTAVGFIDFGPQDFLEPIVSQVRVNPGYVGELGTEGDTRFSCDVGPDVGQHDRGTLSVTDLRLTFLNSHGGSVDGPVVLDDGTAVEGPTTISCRKEISTQPLVWGGYSLAVEALSSEGEVCFSNLDDPQIMVPGETSAVLLARPEGEIPASCRECEADADCALICEPGTPGCTSDPEGWRCVDFTCQSPCVEDSDCVSAELGDVGYSCQGGYCRR